MPTARFSSVGLIDQQRQPSVRRGRQQDLSDRHGPGGDLRPGAKGRRADRVAPADRRAERLDRQDHHRRRAADPDHITLSGVNGVSQQVQYVNVGVTLQIAPRVSSDGFVTSQIYGVVSSVTGYSQGYPTISQREAETSASVRDGETFVIGGLTQDNILTTQVEGADARRRSAGRQAFRLHRSTSSKTELYIVITPHIVRHRRFEQVGVNATGDRPSRRFVRSPSEVRYPSSRRIVDRPQVLSLPPQNMHPRANGFNVDLREHHRMITCLFRRIG